jgi:hypothetical protein
LKKLPAVVLYAISFGFVEAAVVEYLRAIYYPLDRGGFQFPAPTLEQITALGNEHWVRLLIELGRQLCTLIMLMSTGIMAGKNRREACAHFVVAFGVWDISFYLWLKLFLNWPPGLMTWDLLFLIPVPWVGPVLAPIMVSVTMIFSGVIVLRRESEGKPVTARWIDWFLLIVGGGIVIVSFCWDYRNIMNGGLPNPFQWPLFLVGLAVACCAFVVAVRRNSDQTCA